MSLPSISSSSWPQTSVLPPSLQHLMVKAPLLGPIPLANLILAPYYARVVLTRQSVDALPSTTTPAPTARPTASKRSTVRDPPSADLEFSSPSPSPSSPSRPSTSNDTCMISSSSLSLSSSPFPSLSPPSSSEADLERTGRYDASTPSTSRSTRTSTRRAPLSRRANACHSCRLRKTRCVPSSSQDRHTITFTATARRSSSSPLSSSTKSPCTRCAQSGVPCEYSVTGREREHDSKQSYKSHLRARDRAHYQTGPHPHSYRNNKVDEYEDDDDVDMDEHIFDEARLDDGNKDLGHVNGRVPVSSRYPPHMSGPTIERRNKDRPRDVGDVLKHDKHEHEDDDDVCCSVQADVSKSAAYETGPNGTSSNLLSPPYRDLLPWSSVRTKSPFDLTQRHRSPGDVSPKTIAFDPLWPSMAAWHS